MNAKAKKSKTKVFIPPWKVNGGKGSSKAPDEATTADCLEKQYQAAADRIKHVALKHVVSSLPNSIRASWTSGSFQNSVISSGDLKAQVELNSILGKKVRRSVLLNQSYITRSTSIQDAGRRLGEYLVEGILQSGTADAKRSPAPLPKMIPPGHTPLDDCELAALAEKEKKTAAAKEPSRPVCPLCGPADDDLYPEWGPCPHGD